MEAPPGDPTRPTSSRPPDAAIPIARRIAAAPVFFPLWQRARNAPDARLPMVGWFDPAQLLATAAKSLVSLVIGEQSDRRIVQALAARRQEYYDHSIHYLDGPRGPQPQKDRPRSELWLDFISDTGDGWNPTYAVAYAAAQPALRIEVAGEPRELPRADVLVFGGDQVYPTPSRQAYQQRLVSPYTTAFGEDCPRERPHVYAVPGNHDWYDGLSSFTRLFCSDVGGRRFAGWWTRQRRSYFVLKLPHRWWLVASDGQLQADLDVPQIEYLRAIASRHMLPGDKVILCLSVPVWIYAQKYRNMGRVYDETDLLYLREEVFAKRGIEVRVHLAGDLHHYRRHEETADSAGANEPVQKITSGGGGAFLHPTHEDDFRELHEEAVVEGGRARTFEARATYPTTRQSALLAWGNVLFLFRNPRFGIVPAALYLMTAWLVGAASGSEVPSNPWRAFVLTANAFSTHPGLGLWCMALVLGLLAFTDTHSRLYRGLGGLAHAAAHFLAMFYLGWGALDVSSRLFDATGMERAAIAGIGTFVGGWIVGSMIVGLYLLISVNVFGRHSEEAFSSLKIQDFKHFLRLHVGTDGHLTIWPVRIDHVPRKWRDRRANDTTPSQAVPGEPLIVDLIEPPIQVG
jgi:hypothetical protein